MDDQHTNLLIDMLWEILQPTTEDPPVVFYVDLEMGDTAHRLPAEWRIHDVQAASFTTQVTQALADGPVVAFPPWFGKKGSRATPAGDVLREVQPTAGNSLIAVLPAATLVLPYGKALRTDLFTRWRPTIAAYAPGVIEGAHPSFIAAILQIIPTNAGTPPFRMFDAPADWRSSHSRVREDFKRLLRIGGGNTEFGYVMQDPPPFGTPLGYQQNDPRIRRRTEELVHFGRAEYLDHLFDIFQGRSLGPDLEPREPYFPGASRLVAGRDIMRSGEIAAPDDATWVQVKQEAQLMAGDVLMRAIQNVHPDSPGLVWARVAETDLPLTASNTVVVLRPRDTTSAEDVDFVLRYLSSRHARELGGDPWLLGTVSKVTSRALSSMRVPLPDEQLASALQSVEEARRRADGWGAEGEAILASLFEHDSAQLSRQTVIERSRMVRLRVQAIQDIESLSGQVRTQYPLPIAYKWRAMEAAMSGGPSRPAYQSALDTGEQVLAFTACVALAVAVEAGIPVSAVEGIRQKLAQRQGPGMGDWNAVLDEIRGKAFSPLDSVLGSTELRSFCADEDAARARRKLTNRRNDEYHGRKVDEVGLAAECDEVRRDMETLLRRLDFFLDNPLVVTENIRWDALAETGVLTYRRLAGDHPIVPVQEMKVNSSAIESGSLYLLDSNHNLHLLRPFLFGMTCAECGNFSIFHVDRFLDQTLRIKSLEHGHEILAPSVEPAVRSVGLLP